ncbi:Para-nitrobenzyl esterase [Apiospora arundinis]|uniref:Carboxylic ester hydrolase n=1 Tax=Apiospora arundinis TaxID=335852 RepID=A0ABR2IWH0_9PEZI
MTYLTNQRLMKGFDCPQTPSKPVNYPGFTPQAQRILKYFAGGAGNVQNEDCLTLNVWTKPTAAAAARQKPVLIFLYGGRFANGNTHSPFYDGQALADSEDVVVVTLNYRLNIFGFPGAPGEAGNLGLRDQRLAVEWLRDNVASFGGDPTRMVLFGQSAGGVAVDYWAYAYQDDPIVSGLISHSGNAFSFPMNEPSRQASNWHNVSQALGCGADEKSLECMRSKNWTDILKAASQVPAAASDSPVRSTPAFYPQVDEELVFSDYDRRSKDGLFARLPYVLGNNDHEQGYYVISAYGRGINVTKSQGDEFLLTSFTCPNHLQALNRRAAGVPVWQYRYFGDWDNTRLYPTSGAYHGTDLHMLFGNSEPVSGLPQAESQEKTVALVQHLWARFAADPVNGLSEAGWPRFEPGTDSLAQFAYENSPEWNFVKPETFAATC